MMGAGIEGGQTIGGYDEYCLGQPTDLLSGQIQEGGDSPHTQRNWCDITYTCRHRSQGLSGCRSDSSHIKNITMLVGSNSHIQNMESTKHFDFLIF